MTATAARLLQAAILAIGVSLVPLATVTACSCAMSSLDEAVAGADLAFVGTVTAVQATGRVDIGEGLLTTWSVASSRDPDVPGSLSIHSHRDSGANCGISFGMEERWLVLAYRGERGLETSGCMMNRRLDADDPDAEALIAETMTPVTPDAQAEDPGIAVPAPIMVALAAGLVVALVSFVAFRRPSVS